MSSAGQRIIRYHRKLFVDIYAWLNLPDLNPYFKSLKGKFGFLQIAKFLMLTKVRPSRKLVGVLFGIIPEFQNQGIDAFMAVNVLEAINNGTKYNDIELQWIGDFNPKMINIAHNMGCVRTRRLATYRYLFDNNQSFYKHPKLA